MFGFGKKKSTGGIWDKYSGMGNSDGMLTAKGESLGSVIAYLSNSVAESFLERVKERESDFDDEKYYKDVYLETIAVLVHLSDRIAFSILGPEKRAPFIDSAVDTIAKNLSETQEDETLKQQMIPHFRKFIDGKQQEFANYKIPESSDEPMGGTLFWEVSNNYSEICELKHDIITMMTAQTLISSALPTMEVKELLSN